MTSGFVDGSYGVNAHSEHKAGGDELVKWMATPEFGQLFASTLKQISAVPGITPGDPLLAQACQNLQDQRRAYMMVVDFGYGNPLAVDQDGEALQKMLGGTSAADAGKLVQKGISAWFKPSGG